MRTKGYSASGSSAAAAKGDGTKRGQAVGGGEALGEDDRLAGVPLLPAGVGDRAFGLQALPGDAGDARHGLAHLGEDRLRPLVVPVEAEAAGDLLDDPEVLAGLAGGLEGLAAELDAAVGVGEGAGLLGVSGGGQDDVGVAGRLGEEDVLHHQVLQAGEGLAGVVQVGVGHGRVLAHDVHAAHLAGEDRLYHLDHRQARPRSRALPARGPRRRPGPPRPPPER